MPSNHLILCCPLLLPPSILPSTRIFSSESVLYIRWPKYWSFSFSLSPSNEYSRLISFRMDWLDLLAVQRTLKSLLQHHISKASILQLSTFFIVQLSHPYMTTGKTIALTRQTFVGKVINRWNCSIPFQLFHLSEPRLMRSHQSFWDVSSEHVILSSKAFWLYLSLNPFFPPLPHWFFIINQINSSTQSLLWSTSSSLEANWGSEGDECGDAGDFSGEDANRSL